MYWQEAFLAKARGAYAETYWVDAPQGTDEPYATLLDVTETRPQTLKGFDLAFARIQIDVWGLTYEDAQVGMDALLDALVPGGTANGHSFQRADIVLGPRDVGGERRGQDTIYRKSADISVAHREI